MHLTIEHTIELEIIETVKSCTYGDAIVLDSAYVAQYIGMRFFRNFLDLRGHSRGNPRSGLIFMGGGGVPYIVCAR